MIDILLLAGVACLAFTRGARWKEEVEAKRKRSAWADGTESTWRFVPFVF